MKAIYCYDQKSPHKYLGARLEADNYSLVEGETIIAPDSDLINRTFDVEKQKWLGDTISLATPEQQMIAKLGTDVAQTKQMIAKIATMITQQGGSTNE